jgi:hypothetical protein
VIEVDLGSLRRAALSLGLIPTLAVAQRPVKGTTRTITVLSASDLDSVSRRKVNSRVLAQIDDIKAVDDAAEVRKAVLLPSSRTTLFSRRPPRAVAVELNGIGLRHFGSTGSGPGEFRSISDIATVGDSLILLDPILRRISLFHTSTGGYVWGRDLVLSPFGSVAGVLSDGAYPARSLPAHRRRQSPWT